MRRRSRLAPACRGLAPSTRDARQYPGWARGGAYRRGALLHLAVGRFGGSSVAVAGESSPGFRHAGRGDGVRGRPCDDTQVFQRHLLVRLALAGEEHFKLLGSVYRDNVERLVEFPRPLAKTHCKQIEGSAAL